MADLDDFFAKKDRKKSKSVKKFATTDELAKKLEDTKQKTDVRPKKERPANEGEEGSRAGEEEEWKEYEEPVKDYTGLKIQVLQGGGGAPEAGRDPSAEDYAPDSGKGKGPWNKPQQQVEQPEPPPPPPVEEKPRENKPAPYVAPSSRLRAAEPVRRNQSKHAPDIHNDDYFPVLGAGGKRGGGGGTWSTAGAGGGGAGGGGRAGAGGGGAGAQRAPLALGNRFTELRDDS